MPRMKRIDVVLHDEDIRLLDAARRGTGTSRSGLVRFAIRATYGDVARRRSAERPSTTSS